MSSVASNTPIADVTAVTEKTQAPSSNHQLPSVMTIINNTMSPSSSATVPPPVQLDFSSDSAIIGSTSSSFVQRRQEEHPWELIIKELICTLISNLPTATVAASLVAIFRPVIEGFAVADNESKRVKDRAHVYIAEHHRQSMELTKQNHTLQSKIEALQQSLAEKETKLREVEPDHSTFQLSISSKTKVAESNGAAKEASEARDEEASYRIQLAESVRRSHEEAKAMQEKVTREAQSKISALHAELQNKVYSS
ncbi:hypothetical protein KP509_39G058500 [Ceratopteris richardii]|uniref:Uncharacterized protein n=1 Tax=Ceratopteris richardii TaxID=49495 RepID=A0A8T2Q1U0_CERRI|nr:hypothetical protein KP509_39G058500 [Ceratopteris richardii]